MLVERVQFALVVVVVETARFDNDDESSVDRVGLAINSLT